MKHSFDDLQKAFEFVSSAPIDEHQAILNRATGEILHKSGMLDEEEFPEEIETSDDYVWIPHREDLDLGAGLIMDFVEENLPREKKTVKRLLKGKYAEIDFLAFLESRGMLENWRTFEREETRYALLDWCDENEIEVDVEE
jgi:hypothetical protein